MDLLKAQLDRISKQLSGLSASQKMLTAALVAIMAMTLVWWGKYAGEAEMEPLLDQSFSQKDIGNISSNLESRGIHFTVSGDRILVPTDKKFELIAGLTLAHLMPRNTSTGFDEMLTKANNPFNPDTTNQKLFNHGKELAIAQVIEDFPNVAKADVMIDPTREMHVSGSVEPSATIAITMQDGANAAQDMVNGAADLVQGAQAGLTRSQIKVVVDGVPRKLRDPNDTTGDGDETLALQQKAEVDRENRIKDFLSYIPDLKVFVNVKVNVTWMKVHQTNFDNKGKVSGETESTSQNSETSTANGPAGADPGVVPNAIQTPGSGGGNALSAAAPTTTTETKESTKTENFVPSTITDSATPSGGCTVVAASVRVPMAYFEGVYLRDNPGAKPTRADLLPLVTAEIPKIKDNVMKCTALASEKDVSVDTYEDATPVKPAAAQAASALSVGTIVGAHGRDLALAGLAVMSLFMVSMMVRKGTPSIAAPTGGASAGAAAGGATATVGSLNTEEVIAGEVGGSTVLNGMELDESTVRNQEMLEQVSSMVKENPDAAAALVKRWMNRA